MLHFKMLRLTSSLVLSKVFVVVDEVGQLPSLVDRLAGGADRVGQRAWAAAEHAYLAHLKN